MSARNRPPDRRDVVMSEYSGWTIRIRPVLVEPGWQWGALVDVWPPEQRRSLGPGAIVEFPDRALQQGAILGAAIETARRYIEKSYQHRGRNPRRVLKE
jgi:hypothetical protein